MWQHWHGSITPIDPRIDVVSIKVWHLDVTNFVTFSSRLLQKRMLELLALLAPQVQMQKDFEGFQSVKGKGRCNVLQVVTSPHAPGCLHMRPAAAVTAFCLLMVRPQAEVVSRAA